MYGHATVNEFPRAYGPKRRGVRRVRTRFRRRGDHLPDHICDVGRWGFVVSTAMAKTESTAVNSLIELVQSNQPKPIFDPDEDLFAAPKPPAKQAAAPSVRASAPSPAAGTPKRAASPTAKELYAKTQTGPAAIAQARIDMTGDMVRGEDWFEASRAVEKFEEQTYVGTSPHVLHDRRAGASLVKKLILPGIGFIVVGALIGAFIAFNSNGKKTVAAQPPAAHVTAANLPPAQPAARAAELAHGANTGVPTPRIASANAATASANAERPEPPAPTSANALPNADRVAAAVPGEAAGEEVQTTRGVVHLADVRIDSLPAGATVTLVEKTATGEKKSFLGTTPIATSVDPARTYEVVLALQV